MQPIQITHFVPIYWCSLNKIMNVNPVRRLSLLLSIIFIVINRVEYTWCLIPPHVVVNTGCRTQSSTLNVHFEFLSTIFQLSSYCFYRYFFVLRTYRNMCVCANCLHELLEANSYVDMAVKEISHLHRGLNDEIRSARFLVAACYKSMYKIQILIRIYWINYAIDSQYPLHIV